MPGAQATLSGSMAEVVIAHPPLNIFDLGIVTEFEAAVGQVAAWAERGHCRAMLMRAEGPVFCAGVDVHEFQDLSSDAGSRLMARLLTLTQRLEALPIPTLAAVHALNLTIGFELSLGCDLLWACPQASFGLVEASVGLTPGAGGTQRLVARAGAARAAELVLTGDRYSAEEMHRWGVVNRILPADDLLPSARDFAERLASGPTRASAIAKQLILTARNHGVAAANAVTAARVGPLLATEDLASGVASLLEHGPGKAIFRGR